MARNALTQRAPYKLTIPNDGSDVAFYIYGSNDGRANIMFNQDQDRNWKTILCVFALILTVTAILSPRSEKTAIALSNPPADWNNHGDSTLAMSDGLRGGLEGTIYVHPGQTINFTIKKLEDLDTYLVDNTYHPDDQVVGEITQSGGTVSITGTSSLWDVSVGPADVVVPGFTVPADAPSGGTISIQMGVYDTRDESDPRHDEYQPADVFEFTVDSNYPAGMSVDHVDNPLIYTGIPTNSTKGQAVAFLLATGTPPSGRSNWNGTVVTESVSPGVRVAGTFNAAALDANGLVVPAPISGSSFTFGTAVDPTTHASIDNEFTDTHIRGFPFDIRANAGNVTYVNVQTFSADSSHHYAFTVMSTGGPSIQEQAGSETHSCVITISVN